MPHTLVLALGQLRLRPATFFGAATAFFLAVASVTLFGTLIATDAPPAPGGHPSLALLGGAFGEIAVLAALFVVANTLGFAVRQQQRDLALLRAVGATPRQVRRLVRAEVLLLVAVVSPPGWLVGSYGARRFVASLADRGLAAPGIAVPPSPPAMLAGSAVTLLIGAVAAAVAVWRVARARPVEALAGRGLSPVRACAGTLALGGAGTFCAFVSQQAPEKAGQGALLAALMLMMAVALLGPVLAKGAGLLSVPVRAVAPRVGWLADANLRGYAYRLSSAVVPAALLTGLSGTFLFIGATVGRASLAGTALADVDSPGDVWLRQVELVLLACFGGVATVNTLAALTADRRREFALLRLVGATRGQLVRMLAVETLLTALLGVAVGTGVALAAATAFSVTLPGGPLPSVPVGAYLVVLAVAGALTALGVLAAGVRALTGTPVQVATGG
ncbi:ABC transporter permease [Yinghuangia seranimata]|uniref:ABC transporter permease n=1 Tax=Yinghuangia seranimata TaxID=408067 RepID=UPI00248AA545|nr:FtsX-like permease family protein [Yinghuangia seranimata]MDI2127833.1 FtsX-like permease family protein [Yinghuangia seranimata]